MIPVWIDVREQPWPAVPALAPIEWELLLDDERMVRSALYSNFYVRTYALTEDGERLLNLEEGRARRYTDEPDLYFEMLTNALARDHSGEGRRPAGWRFLLL